MTQEPPPAGGPCSSQFHVLTSHLQQRGPRASRPPALPGQTGSARRPKERARFRDPKRPPGLRSGFPGPGAGCGLTRAPRPPPRPERIEERFHEQQNEWEAGPGGEGAGARAGTGSGVWGQVGGRAAGAGG